MNPSPLESAYWTPRLLFQPLNRTRMLRMARRSSSRLMRPSLLVSKLFSHTLNSSIVISSSQERAVTRTALFLMAMIDGRSVSSELWRSLREKQGGVDDGFIRWVKHWLAASWKSGESCVEERGNMTDPRMHHRWEGLGE
ncbi:unnamed protein product, partial [Musa acuminata var. zebrina]